MIKTKVFNYNKKRQFSKLSLEKTDPGAREGKFCLQLQS